MLNAYYEKQGIDIAYNAFRSKGFSANWVISGVKNQSLSMEVLPPFLRTLLVTDGTVTKSLAAFYWEPIVVETLSQEVIQAESEINWLDITKGADVLARYVRLRGGESDTIYARAFSIIRLSLIPAELRMKLLAGSLGIGELLRDCGLETYRELCEFGIADDMSSFTDAPDASSKHIYRTYRINLNHRPAILVTEFFPEKAFTSAR